MDKPCCGNCRYWHRDPDVDYQGWCKRYPPSIYSEDAMSGDTSISWLDTACFLSPFVHKTQWCGEHTPREGDAPS